MTNNEPWDITSDTELQAAVRAETQYDTGKLSADDLSDLIDSAKRVLALRADVTQFYDDRGIAVALLGVTCAKTKGAVENSPVLVENIAGEDVRFRESDGSSLQLGQYEAMTERGLAESEKTDDVTQSIHLTNDYYSDTASR
jgi:hypothetical protein